MQKYLQQNQLNEGARLFLLSLREIVSSPFLSEVMAKLEVDSLLANGERSSCKSKEVSGVSTMSASKSREAFLLSCRKESFFGLVA